MSESPPTDEPQIITDEIALLQEEQAKLEALQEEEMKHQELADKIMELYQKTTKRQPILAERERVLSKQAGQLINICKREEGTAEKVSTTFRRVRHVRKQLLARIAAPRWEIPHHYHMTCCEHILGHPQPHVMDVGEMLPGHLRIFSHARRNVLFTKTLINALARAKQERKNASDKIKEVYRELRNTRAEMKEIEKLLMEIRKKAHLLPHSQSIPKPPSPSLTPSGDPAPPPPIPDNNRSSIRRNYRPTNENSVTIAARSRLSIKSRYYSSLNLTLTKIEEQMQDVIKRDKLHGGWRAGGAGGMGDMDEREWKQMKQLLEDLEKNNTSKARVQAELAVVQSRRNGSESVSPPAGLDAPVSDKKTQTEPAAIRRDDSSSSLSSASGAGTGRTSSTASDSPRTASVSDIVEEKLFQGRGKFRSEKSTTTEMGSVSRILENKRAHASALPQLSSRATSTSRLSLSLGGLGRTSGSSPTSPAAPKSPSATQKKPLLQQPPKSPTHQRQRSRQSSSADETEVQDGLSRPLPFTSGSY